MIRLIVPSCKALEALFKMFTVIYKVPLSSLNTKQCLCQEGSHHWGMHSPLHNCKLCSFDNIAILFSLAAEIKINRVTKITGGLIARAFTNHYNYIYVYISSRTVECSELKTHKICCICVCLNNLDQIVSKIAPTHAVLLVISARSRLARPLIHQHLL